MQVITILDIKPFMQFLFSPSDFDFYSFVSGEIKADMTYTLDGRINEAFFSNDEIDTYSLQNQTLLPWSLAKDKIFSIIKGKKTPSYMKLVLKLPNELVSTILSNANSNLTERDIDGMFVNITFQNEKLNVICGISYKIFTLDKNIEQELSERIITLFKSKNITCE